MSVLPVALIVSDIPIMAASIVEALGGRYRVAGASWESFARQTQEPLDLVVIDVTSVPYDTALAFARSGLSQGCIIVCSLHCNQIDVYRTEARRLTKVANLPSLLSLPEAVAFS